MNSSHWKRFKSRFESEPVVWALWTLTGQIASSVRHRVLATVLQAPGLKVGRGSVFRGVRHIRFESGFSAHGAVWIEAVSNYAGDSFTPVITIGRDVKASNDLHVSCIDHIAIGNSVLFGSRVYVSDHNHGDYRSTAQTDPVEPPALRSLGGGGPVTIEDNVWIGHNVCILGPAHIGFGAIIAANSIVRGRVASQTIVAGAPAVEVKHYDRTHRIWKRSGAASDPQLPTAGVIDRRATRPPVAGDASPAIDYPKSSIR